MFIEVFKEKARNKELTKESMLTYCLVKAIKAKTDDKKALANYFKLKAFNPSSKRKDPYEALNQAKKYVARDFQRYGYILNTSVEKLLTSEEIDLFGELI